MSVRSEPSDRSYITIDEVGDITADDSVSQSGRSDISTSSLASSVARAAARRVAMEAQSNVLRRQLEVKRRILEQRQEFERQKSELDLQELEIEAKVAAAVAEETELIKYQEQRDMNNEGSVSNMVRGAELPQGTMVNETFSAINNGTDSISLVDHNVTVPRYENLSNSNVNVSNPNVNLSNQPNVNLSNQPNVNLSNQPNVNYSHATNIENVMSNENLRFHSVNQNVNLPNAASYENQHTSDSVCRPSTSNLRRIPLSATSVAQSFVPTNQNTSNANSCDNVPHETNYYAQQNHANAHVVPYSQVSGDTAVPFNSQNYVHDMSQVIDSIRLSALKIPTFDGNASNYATFINNFEGTIGKSSVDNQFKLAKLIECCKGKALHVIEQCAVMSPEEGYPMARYLLKKRFGDAHRIATNCIQNLTKGNSLSRHDKIGIQDFADQVSTAIATMASINQLNRLDTEENLMKLAFRLPEYLQIRWKTVACDYKDKHNVYPGVVKFNEFLRSAAERENDPLLGMLGTSSRENWNRGKDHKPDKQHGRIFATSSTPITSSTKVFTKNSCHICGETHRVADCPKLKAMKPMTRLEVIKKRKLCFNCLQYTNHGAGKCVQPNACTKGCKMKHSVLLHDALMSGREGNKDENPDGITVIESCGACTSPAGAVSLPVVPVSITVGNKTTNTFALLDTGSTLTLCSQSLVDKLNVVPSRSKTLSLETMTADKTSEVKLISAVCASITNKKRKKKVSLPNIHVLHNFPNFSANSGEVELLIGQDAPEALRPLEIKDGINGAFAVRTVLGWSWNGPNSEANSSSYNLCNFVQEVKLDNLVERFLKLEGSVDSDRKMSKEDELTVDVWNKSIKLEDGHYQMDIPFRNTPPNLPDNRIMAEKRLQGLQRRFNKDPELFVKYKREIDTLVEKGYAERVSDDNEENLPPKWYIPHHNVFNPKKPEKTRIVFDCAAEHRGTSLNKEVLQGPDFNNSLVGVLLRFRVHPVCVVADVEAMFHQVKVSDQHRDALRFLWWTDGDRSKEPEVYRMTTHLFGGVWSPSCASFALKQTAKDFGNLYDKNVASTVENNFYVDDCLKSLKTEEEAIQLARSIMDLLKKGGFRLTKWMSSSKAVMKSIPNSEYAKGIIDLDLDLDKFPVERTLGLKWNPNSDEFSVDTQVREQIYTKRGLLKTIGSIYDPLGFVCPVVVAVKKLFQNECRRGQGWDQDMNPDNVKKLVTWLSELSAIAEFKVPRCMVPSTYESIQLHVFSDASTEAYGAVAYIRLQTSVDIHTSLVMAKGRLAPMSSVSIPRLELTAAVVAVKLGCQIVKELSLESVNITEVYYWSDSTIVIQYLRNTNKRFQTFVANRIAKIHERSNVSQWSHVPGVQNPADIVSRGMKADELLKSKMWLNGPEFLKQGKDGWPKFPSDAPEIPADDKEVKRSFFAAEKSNTIDNLLSRYSSWKRLINAVTWLRKFITWIKDKSVESSISVQENMESEVAILKYVQARAFPDELKDLNRNKNVSQGSQIFKLDPYLHPGGLMKIMGRLENSSLPESTKHPVILPFSSPVSQLIVSHAHEVLKHAGKEAVISKVRESYWITKCRTVVKSTINSCFTCKLLRGKTHQQRMSDLPIDRVEPATYPFERIGIDVFGPFMVKRGRSLEKRYGCLFTCLNVRAVHIEILHSLDADSFINALFRFIARRGAPALIRCDNGTNLVGGSNEISRSIQEWNEDKKLLDNLLIHNIQWKFNPPTASNFGGVWERLIRSVRQVLNLSLRNQSLTDEKLTTFMTEAESIINQRPLTSVSDDPLDLKALTPNDLLHINKSVSGPPGNFVKQDIFRRSWRHVQFLVDLFWKRWLKEYIPTVLLRRKWNKTQRDIKSDDLVLIADENLPRHSWPLARITKVFPSSDNHVRSAEVKTTSSVLVRPVNKLVLLESSAN